MLFFTDKFGKKAKNDMANKDIGLSRLSLTFHLCFFVFFFWEEIGIGKDTHTHLTLSSTHSKHSTQQFSHGKQIV
jgi:hypothetical protein